MKLFPAAGLAAGLLLAAGPARPADTKPVPEPPLHHLVHSLGGAVRAELRLTPAQEEKLLARRDALWDEAYRTAAAESGAKIAERNRATAAVFRALLDEAQLKRAGELAWQLVWSDPTTPSAERVADPGRVRAWALRIHPTLADALDLSDDQKKLVAANSFATRNLLVVLTAPQAEIARGLMGRVVPLPKGVYRDPRMDRATRLYPVGTALGGVSAPGPLGLLDPRGKDPGPAAELGVTADQERELAKLREPWKGFGDQWGKVSPADLVKKAEALLAETDKGLAAVLKPEQLTRLRQLAVRDEHDPAFGHAADSLVPNLAAELGVTAGQRKAFEAVRARHAEAVAAAALADKGYDAAHRAIRAANRAREDGFEAVLTADQRAKLRALVGDPHPGRGRPDYGPVFYNPAAGRGDREAPFGHHTDELRLLRANKSIQAELNLAPQQLESVQKAQRELTRRFGFGGRPAAENRAEYTRAVADALAAVLTADQAKRFREVMMQQRHFSAAREPRQSMQSIPSAVTYPGVAETVRLTDDQRKRLIDGEHPADILSDQQCGAIRGMLGERFAGDYSTALDSTALDRPFDRPATPRPASPSKERAEFLPRLPWEATKLGPEQVTQAAEAINRRQALFLPASGGGDPAPAFDPGLEPALRRVLAPVYGQEPFARVDQLLLQSIAADGLSKAFARPEVAKVLKLTPAQVVRIADLEEEAGLVAELVGHARLAPDDRHHLLGCLRDRLDERVLAVLTPDQRATWGGLTGDPYPGFPKPLLLHPPTRRTPR